MKLPNLRRDLLLGRLPLVRLVESEPAVGQVAGCAGALVGRGAEFAAGVGQLAEEGGFGVVEDVDDGGGGGGSLGHALVKLVALLGGAGWGRGRCVEDKINCLVFTISHINY